MMHTKDDEIVPYQLGEELRGCFQGEVEFETFEGCRHNSIPFER